MHLSPHLSFLSASWHDIVAGAGAGAGADVDLDVRGYKMVQMQHTPVHYPYTPYTESLNRILAPVVFVLKTRIYIVRDDLKVQFERYVLEW